MTATSPVTRPASRQWENRPPAPTSGTRSPTRSPRSSVGDVASVSRTATVLRSSASTAFATERESSRPTRRTCSVCSCCNARNPKPAITASGTMPAALSANRRRRRGVPVRKALPGGDMSIRPAGAIQPAGGSSNDRGRDLDIDHCKGSVQRSRTAQALPFRAPRTSPAAAWLAVRK